MLDNYPKLKRALHSMLMHPYSARPRLWFRLSFLRLFISRGKGSIVRRNARLDLIPSKRLVVGRRSIIESYTTINNGMGDIIIGDNSIVTARVTLVGPITIGDNVMISNGVHISGLTHSFEDISIPISDQGVGVDPVVIENDVWIGGNSCVNQGVRIGTHSLIGAGSVVTKDIPAYSVAVGNPAKVIKFYNLETGQWERVAK